MCERHQVSCMDLYFHDANHSDEQREILRLQQQATGYFKQAYCVCNAHCCHHVVCSYYSMSGFSVEGI